LLNRGTISDGLAGRSPAAPAAQIGQCPVIESQQAELARLSAKLEDISEEVAERLLAAELNKDEEV